MKKIILSFIIQCLFTGCSKLNIDINSQEGVIPNNQIWYLSVSNKKIIPFGDGEKYFGANIINNVYDNNSDIGIITFDDDVTKIGDSAFVECDLLDITIPNSVTSIGNGAFLECTSLRKITIPNSVTTMEDCVFWHCHMLKDVVVGNNVTSIGAATFYNCFLLKNVVIGNNVTYIGAEAFFCCENLTIITIPDKVTYIGDGAFIGCESMKSATIGNSVTSIGSSAFAGCSSLTSVTIPKSVTRIGDFAFDCSALTSVYCKSTIPAGSIDGHFGYPFGRNRKPDNFKIYVPRASVDTYKKAEDWIEYADCIVGYDF